MIFCFCGSCYEEGRNIENLIIQCRQLLSVLHEQKIHTWCAFEGDFLKAYEAILQEAQIEANHQKLHQFYAERKVIWQT